MIFFDKSDKTFKNQTEIILWQNPFFIHIFIFKLNLSVANLEIKYFTITLYCFKWTLHRTRQVECLHFLLFFIKFCLNIRQLIKNQTSWAKNLKSDLSGSTANLKYCNLVSLFPEFRVNQTCTSAIIHWSGGSADSN